MVGSFIVSAKGAEWRDMMYMEGFFTETAFSILATNLASIVVAFAHLVRYVIPIGPITDMYSICPVPSTLPWEFAPSVILPHGAVSTDLGTRIAHRGPGINGENFATNNAGLFDAIWKGTLCRDWFTLPSLANKFSSTLTRARLSIHQLWVSMAAKFRTTYNAGSCKSDLLYPIVIGTSARAEPCILEWGGKLLTTLPASARVCCYWASCIVIGVGTLPTTEFDLLSIGKFCTTMFTRSLYFHTLIIAQVFAVVKGGMI